MLFDLNTIKREFFAGFPFDIVKVQLQIYPTRFKSSIECFLSIIRINGLSGLYKGCIPPVLMQGLINSFMFTGESITLRFLEPNLKNSEVGSQFNHFIAGSVGGLVSCIVLVPTDVLKCTMQMQATSNITTEIKYKNIFAETIANMKLIFKADGIKGFYKGLGATVLREVPSIGVYFTTYKQTRGLISHYDGSQAEPSSFATLFAGGFAGAVSWLLIYPFDVIKTNAQVASSRNHSQMIISSSTTATLIEQQRIVLTSLNSNTTVATTQCAKDGTKMISYQNMNSWQIGKNLYKRYGLRIFYSGLGTTLVRAFPVNASTFFFYEYFKKVLHVE